MTLKSKFEMFSKCDNFYWICWSESVFKPYVFHHYYFFNKTNFVTNFWENVFNNKWNIISCSLELTKNLHEIISYVVFSSANSKNYIFVLLFIFFGFLFDWFFVRFAQARNFNFIYQMNDDKNLNLKFDILYKSASMFLIIS